MKGLVRSLSRGRKLDQLLLKPRFLLRNKQITIADPGSANAFFTAVVGDLPQGNLLYLGGVGLIRATKVSGGLTDTFTGNLSLGSVASADATLNGSEVDLLPSTAMTTAVSGVSATKRYASSATECGTMLDNTDGSLEVNLNGFIADAAISAEGVLRLDGLIQLAFVPLLDD